MHIFVNSSEIKKGPLLLNCFENVIETLFFFITQFIQKLAAWWCARCGLR